MAQAEREFAIEQIQLNPESPAVFLAACLGRLAVSHADRMREVWRQAWLAAGENRPPPLIVVDDSVRIEALSGAELKALGLMRIPTEG